MINAPYEKEFIFHDGSRVRNLLELTERVIRLSDSEFGFFVNNEKNDFANWIEFVLEEKNLSSRLRMTSSKAETLSILLTYIMNLSSDTQKSSSLAPIKPAPAPAPAPASSSSSSETLVVSSSAAFVSANPASSSSSSETLVVSSPAAFVSANPVSTASETLVVSSPAAFVSANPVSLEPNRDNLIHSDKSSANSSWFKKNWLKKKNNNNDNSVNKHIPDTPDTDNRYIGKHMRAHESVVHSHPESISHEHESISHRHESGSHEHNTLAHDNDNAQKSDPKHAAAARRWFNLFRKHKIYSDSQSLEHNGHISLENKLHNQTKENFSENLLWMMLYGLLIGLILILIIYKFVFNY